MRGDFTRLTFRPQRHYRGVRLQQGRVHLDADFNEHADIVEHIEATTTRDVVGDCGAPISDAGFAVGASGGAVTIGAGRYYVDGILCENEEELGFEAQPDLPDAALPTDAGSYVAYLDVWERHISALEDPSLREIALGGPDTATRVRVAWQVKLEPADASATCVDFGAGWTPADVVSTGRMRARAEPSPPDVDECTVPPGAGYRRLDNQLYRVEIHDGTGPDGPTYKWSRDNGTVVARLENIEDDDLTVSDPGRDDVRGFTPGDWVELSDEPRTLNGEPGVLVQLGPVRGNVLTVAAWPGAPLTMADFGAVPTVRRWDSDGAIELDAGGFVEIEDGVEIEFDSGDYRTGDFWVIPARTLTGDVEWSQNGAGPAFETARGIDHHYCALALLDFDGTSWAVTSDCRELFPPLTELTSLYYVGGDGQEAMPDPTNTGALIALPRPIEVGVANGEHPVEGATVRFEITEGSGGLDGTGASLDALTGPDGVAAVNWEVDSTTQVQRATATLIDDADVAHHLQIRFSANLSVASQVAYDPQDCDALAGAVTVQSALERVSALARLSHVAGDGQEALPGTEVAPLRVRAANGCGPIAGANVRFEITEGQGVLDGAGTSVDTASDADGIAACKWELGATAHRQSVRATLIDAAGAPLGDPATVEFYANLSVASQVAYDNSKCPDLAKADTVQEAIDLLCGKKGGAVPGIRVERITLMQGNTPLRNDDSVAAQILAQGISIFCDREVFQDSVRGKPVVSVVLDLPFPLSGDDMHFWGQRAIGTIPLTLDAQPNADNELIVWVPEPTTAEWLHEGLPQRMNEQNIRFILGHLIVRGNFIWAPDERDVFLDGEVFGEHTDGATDIRLPSGDGRRGGDLDMWFRVHAG